MGNIEQILAKLQGDLRNEIIKACENIKGEIEEIRIKVGAPIVLLSCGKEYYLKGKYSMAVSPNLLNEIFHSIINHSAYAYQDELSKGFITIEGGHRVGVCGRVIMEKGEIKAIKNISSLNIRRCREIIGISDHLIPYLFDRKGNFLHTIIVSPPMCGKTTLLRDIVRNLSELGLRIGVCDERSEIAGTHLGTASFDLGKRTDILDGCPKGEGMLILIRGMSPRIIATDEIGKSGDLAGIEGALCAGVGLLTTIHGQNMEELRRSPIGHLVEPGIFKRYIFLSNVPRMGTVTAITDEKSHTFLSKEYT
jgi:stage III sporulation protein AA